MTSDHWLAAIARITPTAPVNLDDPLADEAPEGQGLCVWPEGAHVPSPLLWDRTEGGATYIGIRVGDEMADSTMSAALRLAAAALERGVNPIILSRGGGPSGFERFGFRVERFAGGAEEERERWEAEISAFWALALIIDAADIAALG